MYQNEGREVKANLINSQSSIGRDSFDFKVNRENALLI